MEFLKGIGALLLTLAAFSVFSLKFPRGDKAMGGLADAAVATFLVEAIFSWPGIGSYISNSITTMDYPAIIGSTLFGAISYIILNLLADIIIASDPRVRL